MIIKKIVLKTKSWLITSLESDTVLSYVFAYNFEKLQNIYNNFIDWNNLPFLITNWYIENTLPRPIYFEKIEKNNTRTSLIEDINQEVEKKSIKKLSNIPMDKEILEFIFNSRHEELREKLKIFTQTESKIKKISEYKNSIPRFNIWDTNPYEIENIEYNKWNYVIYVKIFEEDNFKIFFDCLKNTFEKVWFWKGKSRWYGHFLNVELQELNQNEKEVFDYIEKLKSNNLYFVLNNFKPKTEEIETIDIEKSFYLINSKHTKSLTEFNTNIFKWQMNFFQVGSIIYSEKKLIWDKYQSDNSFNFGFIF